MCRRRSGWPRCDQNVNWIGYKCAPLHADVRSYLSGSSIIQLLVACGNIRFSSLFAAGDVSRGGRRRHEKLDKFIFGTAWLPDLLCKHWFASTVWNFCSWVADVPPRETSKAMFSQAELLAVGTAFFLSFVWSLLEEAIIEAVPLPRLSILQFFQLNINNSALQTEDLYYYSGFQLIKRSIVT